MRKDRKPNWKRDGEILGGGGSIVDLMDGCGAWVTVQGRSDAESEFLAKRILKHLRDYERRKPRESPEKPTKAPKPTPTLGKAEISAVRATSSARAE